MSNLSHAAVPCSDAADPRRARVLHGIFWNSIFQVFVTGLNFVTMLVLVRVIAPAEYGRATTATGLLALLNCFNCSYFIAQAIQLGDREHPDWESHWRAGLRIQLALAVLCNIVAACLWFSDSYRPVAPLLHLGSLGLLVDAPNQISLTMLRREMDFKQMRLMSSAGVVLTAVSSVGLGMGGFGAVAMIVASNILNGLPLGFHLLFVRCWRPTGAWLAAPDWTRYRPALRFGGQLSGTAVLAALRGMIESIVLPRAIGYEAIGLLNRAQVLFSTTVGRITWLIVDTVYPLLPRSAHDPVQFARHARLVAQVLLLISIPGAMFIALEGTSLSRLLYGVKWIAADPLIAPGTVLALGIATASLFGSILQAANRLNHSLAVSVTAACLSLPAILVAWMHGGTVAYAWALAGGQSLAALIAILLASRLLGRGWIWQVFLPPIVSAAIGGGVLLNLNRFKLDSPVGMRLALYSTLFAAAVLAVLRVGFAPSLRGVITHLPGRDRWLRWLRL